MRFIDPDGRSADDIILRGANNSSITIKTDLIDVEVNASAIVGDLGGNYTLGGTDAVITGLDIVGVVDPTPVSDALGATLSAQQGDYWGAGASVLGAALPLVGDLAKGSKIAKGVSKIMDNISTSRAARREVMRNEGIPTSAVPKSQSRNASGREYTYEVPKSGGGTQTKSVQQQTMDSSHQGQPHWEAGPVKTDPVTGQTRMNNYGRPKLQNNKSKVNYPPGA